MRKLSLTLICFLLLLPVPVLLQSPAATGYYEPDAPAQLPERFSAPPFFAHEADAWVDSIMRKLTPEERIGQLFMTAAWSNKDAAHIKEVTSLIRNNKVGGLIFMQGGPVRQANLTNKYQKLSSVPLLIAMDAEWGLAMRLDSTPEFPMQMTMGAMQNDSLIYELGKEMARECKRLGVHVSFSPVADVNNNPKNPVIGTRSFGEDKYRVADKAILYMNGLQDGGVLACGKHFPGHGDTDSDSHKTLPVISHTKERLDSLELYPFKRMIDAGLGSMMVAHLNIPAYDTALNTPTTLSKNVVTELLKEKLSFRGLIFTDALNMKGVSNYFAPGEVDVKALLAGNDMLLFSGNVPKAVQMIKASIAKGEITQEEIDARCRKILMVKKWCGLDKQKLVKVKNLYRDLNTQEANLLCRDIAEHSATLLKNDNSLIPFMRPDTLKIASVAIGVRGSTVFQDRLGVYTNVAPFSIRRDAKQAEKDTLMKKLKDFNVIILSMHKLAQRSVKDAALEDIDRELLNLVLATGKTVVLDVFGPPYALNALPGHERCSAVLLSYQSEEYCEDLSAQVLFGGVSASGRLPVSTNMWPAGSGISTPPATRFKYTMPEEIGFSREALERIDSIVAEGIKEHAYPGCQVFAAKDGKVFLNKSYGHFTYEKKRRVSNLDLYDIASITKIVATVPCVMQLVDENKLNVDGRLGTYLPMVKGTNKDSIILREMLAHQAGLQAWIPFYLRTMEKDGTLKKGMFQKSFSDSFPMYVAPGMFVRKGYTDTIYKRINDSPVSSEHKFLYSDLGYYYLKEIIEEDADTLLSAHAMTTFYAPLGLPTMGYQPRLRFPSARCAPTENDKVWRKRQLQADVHDQGAALMGGIGGHAGVFSNANDVAVMMQLFLNGGTYGGKRYFKEATVNEFTRAQYNGNRRGLGFDKPETNKDKPNPACDSISPASFGHQGFTGTQTWADPETGIVYVFLSNRVYPDAEVNKLAKMGIRTAIMSILVGEGRKCEKIQ